jgi:dienelactone hydrolase
LYEKERATLLAEAGYVAFAADIYGAELQENLDFPTMIAQSTLYRTTNNTLFIS